MSKNVQDPILGRTLADFLVKEKLGEGGFGAVYRAIQLTLGREVVIKVLHTKHRTNQELIERFKREAHLASRLEHPYSAHIYAFGAETDGLLWIAMEYVAGTPLSEFLRSQGGISIERFIPLLDKICEVVYTAHEAGIIHRDLKPANVMVISRAGRLLPKLLDFGIAKSFDSIKPKPKINNTIENQNQDPQKTSFTKNPIINVLAEETTIKVGLDNKEDNLEETDKANQEDFTQTDPRVNQQPDLVKHTVSINPEETDGKEEAFQTEGIMGSPRYMSPEQWEGAANADARSDIYALGVMAYECLTGKAPFADTGYAALMRAHMLKPVPSLGGKFPALLDSVIVKAMAKEPRERYQTALELAAAFKTATGFEQELNTFPKLNEELQEELITTAPRPLAEAIAGFAAARNLYQSKDLSIRILQILLRYLGLLALATYSRIKTENKVSITITKLLNQLYNQGLSEEEWWALTCELVRPFAKHSDIHPLPELVTLAFPANTNNIEQDIKLLFDLKQSFVLTASMTKEQLLPQLEKFITLLTKLLKSICWLSSYWLVVVKDEHTTEKLMGAVRQNYSVEVKRNRLAKGQLGLVDSQGILVVTLSPIMQFLSPTIGSSNEVFFVERNGRRGAKLISWPTGFEHESETPWEWVRENFLALERSGEHNQVEEKSPYLGLMAFSPSDSTMFFGRERETESFLNRLRVQSLLIVVGPSGAGKSSFVQAGVIPGLPATWQAITVRPGSFPITTLSAKLAKIGIEFIDLKTSLQKNINVLGDKLREVALKNKSSVLLVVDQFEEIITLCSNKEEQRLYVEALTAATQLEEDPLRIILTLRDDFLVRIKELTGLRDKISQGLEILTTPAPDELLKILTQPAKQIGYEFEDPELPQEIVKAVIGQTSALPLLAFTAAKLWEKRDRQFKQLSRKVYQSMGGVGGALAGYAEEMMLQMTQAEQVIVRDAFYHLVTSEGTRTVLAKPELIQLLGKTQDSERVLERLVSARLLVTAEGEKGIDRIEIVHEALLSTWPRLIRWRQEMAEGARLRDQLRTAAKQWEERGCPKGLLWRYDVLAEYKLWRERYQGKLTELEEAFAKASISSAERSQKVRRQLLITAISALIIGLIVLYYQRWQTQQQLTETLKLYEEQGRQEMLRGNLNGAAVYLSEAYAKGADTLALRHMLGVAMADVENHLSITLSKHTDVVTRIAVDPNDELAITTSTDKTACIWSVKEGKELFVLSGHKSTINFAEFSYDGKQVVTSSLDGTACVWTVSDGKLQAKLDGHRQALSKAIFSPDGKKVLTISYDGDAKLWDSSTGKLYFTLSGHQNAIYDACFNKKGNLIVTASADKTAKLWDSNNGQIKNTLVGHLSPLVKIAFSPMGKMIVSASTDGTVMLWQTDEGKLVNTLIGHQGGITSVNFSPDGKTVLTSGVDKIANVWDVKTAKLLFTLTGHKKDISAAVFSPNGKLIATASLDKTIRLWESEKGKFLVALSGHQEPISGGMFSNNGEFIVTSSADKTAKIWKISLENRPATQVTDIVNKQVNLYLQDGKLLTKNLLQNENQEQIKINGKPNKNESEKPTENIYLENLGDNIKIEMVKIPSTTFEMGSPKTSEKHLNDELLHSVKLSEFYIAKYEVTQAQWKAVVSLPMVNILLSVSPSNFSGDNLPIENVTWYEALEFCARLSKLTGKNYSLPTEAQWEYAAKAGTNKEYPEPLEQSAWYDENSEKKTHEVGSKKMNAFGLYDTAGNVFEWCLDWYGDYPNAMVVDPKGVDSGKDKIVRGGSWAVSYDDCRTVTRGNSEPNLRYNHLGFRLAMEVPKR